MALLVLILLGLSLGWLTSIIARTEAAGAILRQMGLGMAVALASGLLTNSGSALGGLSLLALGVATVCVIAVLVLYHGILSRRDNAEA
ncbi:MAG: hypothetical protein WBA51_05165 [Erythrobacter sp.]